MTNKIKDKPVTALQDLISGGIAGSVSVLVGHPFDTVKVRLQTIVRSSSTTAAFGGFSSLYRGMGPPLSTAVVVNALIFSSFGESSRIWDECVHPKEGSSLESSNWKKTITCGSFAGLVQALLICPTEHIKCRLQVQHGAGCKDHIFRGPMHAMDSILKSNGIVGLYRGLACTLWRDIPAFGLYFTIYDTIKDSVTAFSQRSIIQSNQRKKQPINSWAVSAFAGGCSGAFTWAFIYPFDVIKSRIQTLPIDTPIEKRRIQYIGRRIVLDHGWKCLFRGLGVTLLRAFPVNGIIFPVYEFTLMQLRKNRIGIPSNDTAVIEAM